MKKKLTPQEARTFEQMCEIPRDNVSGKTWWFMLAEAGDDVTLCQQEDGKPSTATVKIPRRDWDRLVKWYATGQGFAR